MKVLVTGGSGYVGSHTVAALVQAGHESRGDDEHECDRCWLACAILSRKLPLPFPGRFAVHDVRDLAQAIARCLDRAAPGRYMCGGHQVEFSELYAVLARSPAAPCPSTPSHEQCARRSSAPGAPSTGRGPLKPRWAGSLAITMGADL